MEPHSCTRAAAESDGTISAAAESDGKSDGTISAAESGGKHTHPV